jgi:hypothetical protein
MSTKEKIEKDYKKFDIDIEREAEKGLKKIQGESNSLKEAVIKIGENVDRSINEREQKAAKKKS